MLRILFVTLLVSLYALLGQAVASEPALAAVNAPHAAFSVNSPQHSLICAVDARQRNDDDDEPELSASAFGAAWCCPRLQGSEPALGPLLPALSNRSFVCQIIRAPPAS